MSARRPSIPPIEVPPPEWMGSSAKVYRDGQKMGRSIGMGTRPAVLVVDFQRAFTDPESPVGLDVDREVLNTADLLDAARAGNVPILYLAPIVTGEPGSSPVLTKVPSLAFLKPGTNGVLIDERISPMSSDLVIHKPSFSGFYDTELDQRLRDLEIDTIFVAGCVTSTCVRATVLDGAMRGFRMLIVAECVADRTPELHAQHLYEMSTKFGDVVSLDDVSSYFRAAAESYA